jgi:fumarate reductase flavoprotein subunit
VEQTYDVIVVGGGLSGMVAAVRAAMEGLRVAVLEKGIEDRYLCATRLSGGVFHVCMQDVRAEPSFLEQTIFNETGGYCAPELATLIAAQSLRAVTFLAQVGVRFIRGRYPHLSFMLTPPNIVRVGATWEGRGGDRALGSLERRLKADGGDIKRGHNVTGLLSGPNQSCIGVEGVNSSGDFIFRSSSVILADGGFASNLDLVSDHLSPAADRILQRNARRSVGSALQMARSLGAQTSGLNAFYGHVLARGAMTNERLWPYPWLDDLIDGGIIVDGGGLRFCDEGLGGISVANRIAMLKDPLSCTVIFDSLTWQRAESTQVVPGNPNLHRLGATIYQADSLSELAVKAGLPNLLVGEVERYNNSLVSASEGVLKPARSKTIGTVTIVEPPFFAIPACAGITYTLGGPLIDKHARVLSADGVPIRGLYTVGAASGGLEGGDKPGYVGGLIKSAVTGLVAAEHIASTVKRL